MLVEGFLKDSQRITVLGRPNWVSTIRIDFETEAYLNSTYVYVLVLFGMMAILASCHPKATIGACTHGPHFPQTGYAVQDPFCNYFQDHGGTENFGYPIADKSLQNGLVVQYFEKVRLEYHPEHPPRYRIQVGLLGETLGRREPPIPMFRVPLSFNPSSHYHPQTGHSVGQPFLAYYENHGGLTRFGYPLSESFYHQGTLTQDFQRARLMFLGGRIFIADWGLVSME